MKKSQHPNKIVLDVKVPYQEFKENTTQNHLHYFNFNGIKDFKFDTKPVVKESHNFVESVTNNSPNSPINGSQSLSSPIETHRYNHNSHQSLSLSFNHSSMMNGRPIIQPVQCIDLNELQQQLVDPSAAITTTNYPEYPNTPYRLGSYAKSSASPSPRPSSGYQGDRMAQRPTTALATTSIYDTNAMYDSNIGRPTGRLSSEVDNLETQDTISRSYLPRNRMKQRPATTTSVSRRALASIYSSQQQQDHSQNWFSNQSFKYRNNSTNNNGKLSIVDMNQMFQLSCLQPFRHNMKSGGIQPRVLFDYNEYSRRHLGYDIHRHHSRPNTASNITTKGNASQKSIAVSGQTGCSRRCKFHHLHSHHHSASNQLSTTKTTTFCSSPAIGLCFNVQKIEPQLRHINLS